MCNSPTCTRPKSSAVASKLQALSELLRDNFVDKASTWASKSRREPLSSSPSPRDSDTESCDGRHGKKGRKSTGKEPTDKPKRPLSAYNIFFQHEREKILLGASDDTCTDESAADTILLHKILSRSKGPGKPTKKREHVRTHGKIGFVELAKKVATKWKGLDDASRAVYTALAAVEKAQYKKEVDLWEKKRITDADQELMKIEKKEEALRMQRIMQGSRGIFEEQNVMCPASSTTYQTTNQSPMAISAAHSMTTCSSISDSVKVSVGMSHAELMENGRAELAAKMSSGVSHSRDFNVGVEIENNTSTSLSNEGVAHRGLRSVGGEGYCRTGDNDAVQTMHTCMQSFGWHNSASMPPSSSEVLAEEQDMQQPAADDVGRDSTQHNAAMCMPEPTPFAPQNVPHGIGPNVDLHNFHSDSSFAETPTCSHSSLAWVDKDFEDFLVWMSKEEET